MIGSVRFVFLIVKRSIGILEADTEIIYDLLEPI